MIAGYVQFDVKRGDIAANLDAAVDGLLRLKAAGADLGVLPEMWSCGFDYPDLNAHARKTPGILSRLGELAASQNMLVAGSLPELSGRQVFNTSYLIERTGAVAGSYRKVHLFAPIDETRHLTPGNRPVVCDTSLGGIGMMICYDLRFPELCRVLALKGAGIILVCAQWPASRASHWDVLLGARAIENQVFIIAANRCGADGALKFAGRSQIVSPSGNVLKVAGDGGCAETAALDLTLVESGRRQFNCLSDRVPEAYDS